MLLTSVSEPLWDRGPINSFFIRRGPGPNKFTRKSLSIFLSSYIKLTWVLIINYGIIIESISTLMYTVWHVDKYKITFKLVINHWINEILQHVVVSSGQNLGLGFIDTFTNIFLLRIFPLYNIYSWKMLRKLKWQIPGEPLTARYNWCQGSVPGRGPSCEKHCCTVCQGTQKTPRTLVLGRFLFSYTWHVLHQKQMGSWEPQMWRGAIW